MRQIRLEHTFGKRLGEHLLCGAHNEKRWRLRRRLQDKAWFGVHIALRRWVLWLRLRQAGPGGRCCRRPLGSVREDVVGWLVASV